MVQRTETAHLGQKRKQVWILGAKGYSGLELCRLVLNHPNLELTGVYATEAGKSLSHYVSHPLASKLSIQALSAADFSQAPDCVFLATPAEVSLEWVKRLRAQGIACIDLSGAYRLAPEQFELHYGHAQTDPEGWKNAVYGLVPFRNQAANGAPFLVSNPGCFVTSILHALIPLFRMDLVDPGFVVVDSKTGTTGAGKRPVESQLFAEVSEGCSPYKIGAHQHQPEIETYLQKYSGIAADLQFSTHLLPVRRGILSSIYLRPKPGRKISEKDILNSYQEAYANYPLVEFGAFSEMNLALPHTVGTPMLRIGVKVAREKIFVFSVIDNLLKGAASQAIENVNVEYGWPVETGLILTALAGIEKTKKGN